MRPFFVLQLSLCFFLCTLPLAQAEDLKVSLVQYPMEANQSYESMMKKIRGYIDVAVKDKPEIIVFPEYLTLDMWDLKNKKTDRQIVDEVAKHSERFVQDVVKLAKQHNTLLIAGTIPRQVGQKQRNSAVIAYPDGQVDYQDKIFFTPWDKDMAFEEGRELKIFKTPSGHRFSVLICFDIEFPRLSQMLSKDPPELLIVPSMTESDGGFRRVRYSAQARAVENHAYVAVVGTVGKTDKTWINVGQAAFLSPQEGDYPALLKVGEMHKPAVYSHTFDMSKLKATRAKSGYNPSRVDKGKSIQIKTSKVAPAKPTKAP